VENLAQGRYQNHDRYTLSKIFKVLISLRNQHPSTPLNGALLLWDCSIAVSELL